MSVDTEIATFKHAHARAGQTFLLLTNKAFKYLLFPFSCLQSFYVNSCCTFLIILSSFPLLDGWGFQTYNLKCPRRIYIKTIKPRKWKPQNMYINFFQSLLRSSLVNIYKGIQFSILTSFSPRNKCGRLGW